MVIEFSCRTSSRVHFLTCHHLHCSHKRQHGHKTFIALFKSFPSWNSASYNGLSSSTWKTHSVPSDHHTSYSQTYSAQLWSGHMQVKSIQQKMLPCYWIRHRSGLANGLTAFSRLLRNLVLIMRVSWNIKVYSVNESV